MKVGIFDVAVTLSAGVDLLWNQLRERRGFPT